MEQRLVLEKEITQLKTNYMHRNLTRSEFFHRFEAKSMELRQIDQMLKSLKYHLMLDHMQRLT